MNHHQQPTARRCFHIWPKKGGAEGMEIPSLSPEANPKAVSVLISLICFYSPYYLSSNPTCRLARGLMHKWDGFFFVFFWCLEKHGEVLGMERFGVAGEEKVLSVDTDSLTTSHPPDRKSAMFLLRDVFFQVEAPRAAVQKAGVF